MKSPTYEDFSTIAFMLAKPCSKLSPIILSQSITRLIALAMKLFLPDMLQVTLVSLLETGSNVKFRVAGAGERFDEIEPDSHQFVGLALDDRHAALAHLGVTRPEEFGPFAGFWPFIADRRVGIQVDPWRPGIPLVKVIHLGKHGRGGAAIVNERDT